MRQVLRDPRVALLCLLVIVVVGTVAQSSLDPKSGPRSDIYYSFVEGERLNTGQIPYARILAGNMRDNDKYATYFPLFYWLSALSQRLGLRDYDSWIEFWRKIFMLFNAGAACVLLWILHRQRAFWLAVLGVTYWFCSRWNAYVTQAATLEYMPIFFLLLSLGLLPRHRTSAYLAFGLSLALKQIAIWLVPIYLIWAWKMAPTNSRRRWQDMLLAGAAIAAVPLLASLPFLLTDSEGFFRSVVFSATRMADTHVNAPSLSVLFNLSGPAARLPMLALMCLPCFAFWRGEIGIYRASLLLMVLFVDLNPVLFLQYFAWTTILLLPALGEGRAVPWPERSIETGRMGNAEAEHAMAKHSTA